MIITSPVLTPNRSRKLQLRRKNLDVYEMISECMKSQELSQVEAPNWSEFLILHEDSNDFRIACFESKSISRTAPQREESWRIQNAIKMQ